MTTEKIDLGGGEWAEIRTDLTRVDRKWWRRRIDEVRRSNGTAKPAYTGPDPDNPAQLREVPAVEGYITPDDDTMLKDELTAKLLIGWSLPQPWSSEYADTWDLDTFDALDDAVIVQMRRLQGLAPKKTTSATSASTSPDGAGAPRTE